MAALAALLLGGSALVISAGAGGQRKEARSKPRAGQLSTEKWKVLATFDLGGEPDWMAITDDSVWISNQKFHAVHRINPITNQVEATIELPAEPCSGLVFAFGSLWVPVCSEPTTLVRIDPSTNQVAATLEIGPADSEGSIAASEDSIWMVTDGSGTLLRIDPLKNEERQEVHVPAGSFNPIYSEGTVWVAGTEAGVLTPVDAASGIAGAPVAVGPQPRFLTSGAGSIWALNQGDGSVSRVDAKTRRVVATIQAGIPGRGGEIAFGAGALWASTLDTPLTKIDAQSNQVVGQWVGPGGDSVRFGHGTVWLTDLRRGLLWRLPVM